MNYEYSVLAKKLKILVFKRSYGDG